MTGDAKQATDPPSRGTVRLRPNSDLVAAHLPLTRFFAHYGGPDEAERVRAPVIAEYHKHLSTFL